MTPQMKWDTFLLTSFYKRPHLRMYKVIKIFNRSTEGLLRVPHDRQIYSTTTVFICNCLPKALSAELWGKTITDIFDIASKLPSDGFDTLDTTYSKLTKEELREKLRDKRKDKVAVLEQKAQREFNYKTSKNQVRKWT